MVAPEVAGPKVNSSMEGSAGDVEELVDGVQRTEEGGVVIVVEVEVETVAGRGLCGHRS